MENIQDLLLKNMGYAMVVILYPQLSHPIETFPELVKKKRGGNFTGFEYGREVGLSEHDQ